jgi:hypothetical protein
MTDPNQPPAEEVAPSADSSTEPTPVGDEAEQAAKASNGAADPSAAEPDPAAAAPDTAKSFQVDVSRALQRETHDGKGDEEPGESDWQGYATEGVEQEESQ